MKLLLLSASLVFSSNAFAKWIVIDRTTTSGNSAEKILQIFQGYKTSEDSSWLIKEETERVISGYTQRNVTNLTLTVTNYEWIGPNSTCQASDKRRFVSLADGKAIYSNGDGVAWQEGIVTCGENWDPCGGESSCTEEVKIPKVTRSITRMK